MTESELAPLLDLSSARIRQLVRDGVIPKAAPGRFDHRVAVPAYCRWISDRASRGTVQNDALKVEKIRQARAAAEKIEIQNALSRGDLVPAADVRREWSDILATVRSVMLAIPSRLTTFDKPSVDRAVRDALAGLGDHG